MRVARSVEVARYGGRIVSADERPSVMYDVIVAGLGGMGSAVAAHCARRGANVLGLERFHRGHDFGASSGKTRIIRQAYFEDAAYVPLLLRAYELWRELERTSGVRVLNLTGLLLAGYEGCRVLDGSMRAARAFDLPVDYLTSADIKRNYPALSVRDDEAGVFEREGGAVFPEIAIDAYVREAIAHGARLQYDVPMVRWEAYGTGVAVTLTDGSRIEARRLVLTLGPWLVDVLEALGIAMRVQRNVQVWFEPRSAAYAAAAFPAFLLERKEMPSALYGFPDFGDGVKAAFHGKGELTSADALRRDIVLEADVEPVARALDKWMPGAAGRFVFAKACMYSITPDEHFVVDIHPLHSNVTVCGGFSGHGFKFASVVGEIGADLALDGGTRHDIGFLSASRFTAGATR